MVTKEAEPVVYSSQTKSEKQIDSEQVKRWLVLLLEYLKNNLDIGILRNLNKEYRGLKIYGLDHNSQAFIVSKAKSFGEQDLQTIRFIQKRLADDIRTNSDYFGLKNIRFPLTSKEVLEVIKYLLDVYEANRHQT